MAEGWTTAQIPNLAGKRAIVTGANIGLGYQTALALARADAEVVLACRSLERGQAAAARIVGQLPEAHVVVAHLDLSRLDSVHAFAAEVLAAGEPIDILVNNAGIMAVPARQTTVDGFELQLGTNYLGHYALTGLLLPALLRAPSSRVVSVSSNAHKRGKIHFDDLQLERGYTPWAAYSQTKLAMLLYARELQRQSTLHGAGLVSIAAHPGLSATAIGRDVKGIAAVAIPIMFKFLGQDDAQGALPQLFAATVPGAEPGGYYGPDGWMEFKGAPAPAAVSAPGQSAADAARLWQVSEQLTGVAYPWPL